MNDLDAVELDALRAAKDAARCGAWLAKAAAEVEAAKRRDHREALALALRAMRAAMRDAPWHYATLRREPRPRGRCRQGGSPMGRRWKDGAGGAALLLIALALCVDWAQWWLA